MLGIECDRDLHFPVRTEHFHRRNRLYATAGRHDTENAHEGIRDIGTAENKCHATVSFIDFTEIVQVFSKAERGIGHPCGPGYGIEFVLGHENKILSPKGKNRRDD